MGNTPICTIDQYGIHRPDLGTILSYFNDSYGSIYGSDVVEDSALQDSQFLGLLSSAVDDTNGGIVSAYNAYAPTTAQGVGLSSVVKTNGIARNVPSYSTAPLLVVGVAYLNIANGVITDPAGNPWALPASVTIPAAGQIAVTVTCAVLGAISVAANTVATIATQTRGWQSATFTGAATAGLPVETDAALRVRQSNSTASPALTVLTGIIGDISDLPGVVSCQGYENDTMTPDVNGLPGQSMAFVVNGGTPQAIANAIGISKSPGSNTYGTTSGTYVDPYGIGHAINWFAPNLVPIYPSIRIQALSGYTVDVGTQIQNAVSAYISGLGTGVSLLTNRLNVPANLGGAQASETYKILSLLVARANQAASANDVIAKFTDLFTCAPGNVKIVVALA